MYTLEKVLKFRKDPLTQISFMDEALKVSHSVGSSSSLLPLIAFGSDSPWVVGGRHLMIDRVISFGRHCRQRWKHRPRKLLAVSSSTTRSPIHRIVSYIYMTVISASSFIQTNLSTNYPRLLRLFHDFFSKIAVHTDTVYTPHQQRFEHPVLGLKLKQF